MPPMVDMAQASQHMSVGYQPHWFSLLTPPMSRATTARN